MKNSEVNKEPHYVDVMETWSIVLASLFAYLTLCFGIADFVADNIKSPVICIVGMGFILCVAWLPGLLMVALRESFYERIARLKSVYQNPRRIRFGKPSTLRQWKIGGPANIAAMVAIFVLAGLAVIMSIVGIAWDDAVGISIAVGSGALLSWTGALIISLRMVYDVVSERRKMRWVF